MGLTRGLLLRVHRCEIAHRLDIGMAIERVVVDRHLGIGRKQRAIFEEDQRIDLNEHGVLGLEDAVQLGEHHAKSLALIERNARGGHQLHAVEAAVAERRIDVQARQHVGMVRRDVFDVHAAHRRQHQQWHLGRTIEGDRDVILLGDRHAALDPQAARDVPLDVEAEDRLGCSFGLVGVLDDLDAARLAATTNEHLALDDNGAAEFFGRCARLGDGVRNPTLGNRDARFREQFFALMLVQIHGASRLTSSGIRGRCRPRAG